MQTKIEKVLEIWHEYFADEERQYSEFESSDIEYFVGCMLYNHFAFSKALENLKTMDLSYDFLSVCGSEYDEIKATIESLEFEDEKAKLAFLQNFIAESKLKYKAPELYLLNRMEYHVDSLAQRYENGADTQRVDFQNPLYR
ncbi:MAG: hypothetical protein AUK54_06300 [Helicobacteraceae bacterium CG2_30_36_10]|nr:MAG: hypothetical protein AUK54_06300 [Helicobacteraceae bacterium CG2_30_36_10]